MYFYRAYGLNIRSDFLLSELISGGDGSDLYIQRGTVDLPPMENSHIPRQGNEAWFGGTVAKAYLHWPGVAQFVATGGDRLIVDPTEQAIECQILSLYILSEALGMILHQRNLLLIHASAILIGDRVIIFAGVPGAGKSTTAAAFAQAGYPVLSDDMVAIDVSSDPSVAPSSSAIYKQLKHKQTNKYGQPDGSEALNKCEQKKTVIVLPAFPQVKIWPASIEGLGYDHTTLDRLFPSSRKRVIRPFDNFPLHSMPLTHIFFLELGGNFTLTPIVGHEAILALTKFFSCPSALLQGKALARHFQQCSQILKNVSIWTLKRPDSFQKLHQFIDQIDYFLDQCQQKHPLSNALATAHPAAQPMENSICNL